MRGNDQGAMAAIVRENIKHWREVRGITQAGLAQMLDDLGRPIPVASVAKIESGDRRIDVDDLAAIAEALAIPPTSLIANTASRRVVATVGETLEAAKRAEFSLADYNRRRLDLAIAADDLWQEGDELDDTTRAQMMAVLHVGPLRLAMTYETDANPDAQRAVTVEEASAMLDSQTIPNDPLGTYMDSTRFRGEQEARLIVHAAMSEKGERADGERQEAP